MSGGGTAGGRIAPGVGANLIGQHAQDRNQDATVYMGNLDPQVGPLQFFASSNCILVQQRVRLQTSKLWTSQEQISADVRRIGVGTMHTSRTNR